LQSINKMKVLALAVLSLLAVVTLCSSFNITAPQAGSRVVGYVNTYGVHWSSTPYNVLILAFLYPSNGNNVKFGGSQQGWQTPTTTSQVNLAAFANAGGLVFLSVGGADWSSQDWRGLIGQEATFAQNVRNFANQITSADDSGKLQAVKISGIDIDYEDNGGIYPPGNQYDGVTLLVNLSQQLKNQGFLVTHAPQGPYLCTPAEDNNPAFGECKPGIGGYLDVMQRGGQYIDWLNIQYYNNPSFDSPSQIFDNYQGLANGFSYNGANLQISPEKMLVGKPNQQSDAGSGYIPVGQLVSQVLCPLKQKYPNFGGAMTWKYHGDGWAATVSSGLNGC